MENEGSISLRTAARSANISALVSAVGIVFLVLLYVGFFVDVESLLVFGPLNDLLIIVQYILALPISLVLHRILKPQSPRMSLVALAVAFVGIAGVVAFQLLLLTGVMDFTEQVVYASTFLLVVGIWIVMASDMGRRSGKLRISAPVMILGALYIGYPLWAYRVAQQLTANDQAANERMA